MYRKVILVVIGIFLFISLFGFDQDLDVRGKRSLRSANMYLNQKNFEKAQPLYEEVLEQNPNHLEALEKLGGIYYQVKSNYFKASELYQKALSIIDNIYSEYENLKNTDPDEAEDFYDDYIDEYELAEKKDNLAKLKNNCWIKIYQSALKQYKAEKYDKALELYQKLYDTAPDSIKTAKMLGYTHLKLENKPKALEYLEKVYQAETDNPSLTSQIAGIHFNSGNYEDAAKYYKKLTKIDSTDSNNFFNLGLTYMKLDKNQKSLNAYKKVIELEPENVDALLNAFNLANKLGKTEEATNYLKKVVNLEERENLDNLQFLCYQLFRLKQYEELIGYAQSWEKMDSSAKEPLQLIYQAADKLGKQELKKEYTQKLSEFKE